MDKPKYIRWFEVEMQNGVIAMLNEQEIEQYRAYVKDVRTEFTKAEVDSIGPAMLNKELLGIE